MSEWIELTDAKPNVADVEDVLLVYGPEIGVKAAHIYKGSWYEHGNTFYLRNVTHWMPLPAPPLPEGENYVYGKDHTKPIGIVTDKAP